MLESTSRTLCTMEARLFVEEESESMLAVLDRGVCGDLIGVAGRVVTLGVCGETPTRLNHVSQ